MSFKEDLDANQDIDVNSPLRVALGFKVGTGFLIFLIFGLQRDIKFSIWQDIRLFGILLKKKSNIIVLPTPTSPTR